MRTIYILIFLCLFTGCKVKKNLSVSIDERLQQTEQKDIKQAESTQTEITGHRETEKETITEGVTIVYDTEKPIDSATGKPPVKSETKWKQEAKEKAKEEAVRSERKDTRSEDKSKSDVLQGENVKIEQSREQEVFRVSWSWILAGGAVVGVWLGGKYLRGV